MTKYILLMLVYLFTWFEKSIGNQGQSISTPHINGTRFCHSIDFVQEIKLESKNCQGHTLKIYNRRCAGICGLRFIPNPDDPRLTPSDLCVMCRPEISEIEMTINCGIHHETVKLLVVKDCQCKSVDCLCGQRRPT
eukprot:TCONS_00025614-protein